MSKKAPAPPKAAVTEPEKPPLHERLGLPPRQTEGSRLTSIRLPVETISRATRLAARKGIGYQTFMKVLIHEGLERAEREN
jgi:hypothetical protein